jgi:hypothetical protein
VSCTQGPCDCDDPHDISRIYAWIARDADGIEGVVASPMRGGMILPLVGADMERVTSLEMLARAAGVARGVPVTLVRFERAETTRTIWPPEGNRQDIQVKTGK